MNYQTKPFDINFETAEGGIMSPRRSLASAFLRSRMWMFLVAALALVTLRGTAEALICTPACTNKCTICNPLKGTCEAAICPMYEACSPSSGLCQCEFGTCGGSCRPPNTCCTAADCPGDLCHEAGTCPNPAVGGCVTGP